VRIPYGDDPNQFGDLLLPETSGLHPVAVAIHGGFWRARFDLDHMAPVCMDLALNGVATWNIEYRRIGQSGGGWPGTAQDALKAFQYLETLAAVHPLDLDRVVLLGFSAGGHLALWIAGQKDRPAIAGVVSLAGVADLRLASEMRLSNGVVDEFMSGGPLDVAASPIFLLPTGVKTRLVHGASDLTVPIEIARQYTAAAIAAGDDTELIALPNTDHSPLIDPNSDAWRVVRDVVFALLRRYYH
jgi:acetyl esterase/lipase